MCGGNQFTMDIFFCYNELFVLYWDCIGFVDYENQLPHLDTKIVDSLNRRSPSPPKISIIWDLGGCEVEYSEL